jgi:tyrosinase
MTQPNQPAVRVRQSILNLTAIEMGHYVQAVKQLKSTDAPGGDPSIPAAAVTTKISVYDFYVQLHVQAMQHAVHKSPWFLPWHRQYILNFENALRLVGGYPASLGLPYWDWAGDPPNAREKKSKVWAGIFMGGDGELPSGPDLAGDVVADVNTASPFARGRWALTIFEYPPPAPSQGTPAGTNNLRRGMGRNSVAPHLPTQPDVDGVLARPAYDSAPWNGASPYATSFRNAMEGWVTPAGFAPAVPPGMHNRAHVWVGGSMVPASAPNDPVFFLHHANIDRIWARWQDTHPGLTYLPATSEHVTHDAEYNEHPGWLRWTETIGGDDPMWPWTGSGKTVTPNDVWNYKNLGYLYDTLWPAFPQTRGYQVPQLTPLLVGLQWAPNLLGPGWGVFRGTFNPSTQSVDARSSMFPNAPSALILQGQALAPSLLATAVGGYPVESGLEMCPVYLCLRGPGAALQHPVLQGPGDNGPQQFLQLWNGYEFVDNLSGKPGVVPMGPNGDCWFRIQPPKPSAGGWRLVCQASETGLPFTAWAYLEAATPVPIPR